jgi:hypothetical protein
MTWSIVLYYKSIWYGHLKNASEFEKAAKGKKTEEGRNRKGLQTRPSVFSVKAQIHDRTKREKSTKYPTDPQAATAAH